jgi:hypothetical protein
MGLKIEIRVHDTMDKGYSVSFDKSHSATKGISQRSGPHSPLDDTMAIKWQYSSKRALLASPQAAKGSPGKISSIPTFSNALQIADAITATLFIERRLITINQNRLQSKCIEPDQKRARMLERKLMIVTQARSSRGMTTRSHAEVGNFTSEIAFSRRLDAC